MSRPTRHADGAVRSCIISVTMELLREHFQIPKEAELVATWVDSHADILNFRFVGIGHWVEPGDQAMNETVMCSIDPDGGMRQAVKFEWPKGGEG